MISGLVVGFVAGALVCYLFLRNNPAIKDKVDDVVDDIDEKLD